MVIKGNLLNSSQPRTAVFSVRSDVRHPRSPMQGRRACEAKRSVAIIGSVPKCVAHSEQNESVSVIVPIKCLNIFCDLPLGIGVFQQVLPLWNKQSISDAHECGCSPFLNPQGPPHPYIKSHPLLMR